MQQVSSSLLEHICNCGDSGTDQPLHDMSVCVQTGRGLTDSDPAWFCSPRPVVKRMRTEPKCEKATTQNRQSPTCIVIDIDEPSKVVSTPNSKPANNTIELVLMELSRVERTRRGNSVMARAIMCAKIQDVYSDLVRDRIFMCSDIRNHPHQQRFLKSSGEDPMGVLAAAQAIIRHAYRGELAENELIPSGHWGLSKHCRHFMAAALFLAYKAKTEDTWGRDDSIPRRVLSKFVTHSEYDDTVPSSRFATFLTHAEMQLLKQLPIHILMECNVHSVVEAHLGVLVERGVMGYSCAFATLSCLGITLNEISTMQTHDSLSQFHGQHHMKVVANGMLCASIACVRQCKFVDKHHLPSDDALRFNADALGVAECTLNALIKHRVVLKHIPPAEFFVRELVTSYALACAHSSVSTAKKLAQTLGANTEVPI